MNESYLLCKAKSIAGDNWVYGFPRPTFDGWVMGLGKRFENCGIIDIDEIEISGKSISRFTGLCDATRWEDLCKREREIYLTYHKKDEWCGKEIFENDILKRDGYWSYFVGFKNGSFVSIPLNKIQRLNWKHYSLINYIHDFKVSGNLYDFKTFSNKNSI